MLLSSLDHGFTKDKRTKKGFRACVLIYFFLYIINEISLFCLFFKESNFFALNFFCVKVLSPQKKSGGSFSGMVEEAKNCHRIIRMAEDAKHQTDGGL